MAAYEIQIALDIFLDKEHPNDIIEKVGISPNSFAVQGQRNKKLNIPRQSFVSYMSEASQFSSDLEEHWSNFKTKFITKEKILSEIGLRNYSKFTIIVKPEGRVPGLMIERDFVRFASAIHACIDVDIYEVDNWNDGVP